MFLGNENNMVSMDWEMRVMIYRSFVITVSIFNHGHAKTKWALPCFGDKLLKPIDSQAMLYTMS